MAGYLEILYRRTKSGETIWHNVTDYLKKIDDETLIAFKATLDGERKEFDIYLGDNETDDFFQDEDGVEIFPLPGDDICICTDITYTEVFQEMTGWIINIKPIDKTYLPDSLVTWQLRVKHRDFSNNYVTIDQPTVIADTALFDLIINNNSKSFLGGTMPSGTVIPAYSLEYNTINFPSFKGSGSGLEVLDMAATGILGLHYKFKHYVEPHIDDTIQVIQSISIFDGAGDSTITQDWEVGINNQTLTDGEIPNWKFIDYDTTPDEPETILCEQNFQPEIDATGIKNVIRLNGFTTDGTGIITYETFTQQQQQSTFTLSKPGIDILSCARLVDCKIISKVSDTVFNIDLESAQEIAYDKTRLNNTGYSTPLKMWIRANLADPGYTKEYTIINQTVTLASAGGTIALTDLCWHVNGYDVLKTGLNTYPSDDDGFVKKELKWGEKCFVIFSEWDKPIESETVIVGYYALDAFRLPHIYEESKEVYDMGIVTEEIPFPITQAQFDTISAEYKKYTEPREIFTFSSRRENVLQEGWKLPVSLIHKHKVSGNYIVNSVNGRVITSDGYYFNKPLVILDNVELVSYRDDLSDFLKKFKNQFALTEALLQENTVKIFTLLTKISIQKLIGFALPAAGVPQNLIVTANSISSVSFAWDADSMVASWEYRVSKYNDYVEGLTGYNFPPNVVVPAVTVNSILGSFTAGDTLYFSVRSYALYGGAISEWSPTLSVVVEEIIYDFPASVTVDGIPTVLDFALNLKSLDGIAWTDLANSNTVALYGPTSWDSDVNWGHGINLSTINSALRVTDHASYELTNKFTLMAVIKTGSIGIRQFLLNKFSAVTAANNSYQLFVETTNKLIASLYNTASVPVNEDISTTGAYLVAGDTNNFKLVIVSLDLSTDDYFMLKGQTSYANSVIAGSTAFTQPKDSALDLFIGSAVYDNGATESGTNLQGSLWRLAILNTQALTLAQAQAVAAAMGLFN